MAVTLEAAPTITNSGTNNITSSVVVGSGANRLLVVFFAFDSGVISGTPQYGGVNLTKLAGSLSNASFFAGMECWYLINPTTGTANLTATKTGGTNWSSNSYVFDGANQTTPLRALAGAHAASGTSSSHTVSGFTSGDYGIDIQVMDVTGHSPTPSAGQTADYATQSFGAGTTEWRGSNDQVDGVMGWTWTTSADNCHGATAVIPALAGGAPIAFYPWNPKLKMAFPKVAMEHPVLDSPPVGGNIFNQALDAVVSSTASIQKQVNKLMTATATSTATITKQVNKAVIAVATTTAILVKKVLKNMTAPATVTGSIQKQVNKTLTYTVTTTASIQKQINKLLTAVVTTTASVIKQTNKTLVATVTTTASIVALKVVLLTLTAVVTSVALIQSQVNKLMNAAITVAASIQKQVNKTLTASLTSTASITALKVILATLTAVVSSTATISRQVNKLMVFTTTVTGTITKTVTKTLSATATVTATIARNVITTGGAVVRRISQIITIGRF